MNLKYFIGTKYFNIFDIKISQPIHNKSEFKMSG